MNLRGKIQEAMTKCQNGNLDGMESLVAEEPRVVRHLLGMTYHPDESRRRTAARAIALAAHHHPKLVQEVVRRLVWAMNDESGTNALTAPEVLQAIAEERPDLLLPVVPDLTRLAGDPGLHDGLAAALKTVTTRCPGEVGERLSRSLGRRIKKRRRV